MKEQIHGGDVYRHPNAIDFSSNMNPLGTPPSVIEAARESMDHIEHYPDIFCSRLIQELSATEQVPEEWLLCGNGAAELIFALVHAISPKKAVVAAPTFAEYGQALSSCGCQIHSIPLKKEKGFYPDEEVLSHIEADTDLVILCNPNNPTGCLIPQQILEQVLEFCRDKKIILMIDECFLDFVKEPELHTRKKDLITWDGLILLKAFTKRYAMAGLRLGYVISSNMALLERMASCMQPWNVSIPAQAAGVAALRETAYVEEGRRLIFSEKEYLIPALWELGLHVYGSEANYIFFSGPEGLREACLEYGILIRSCANYEQLDGSYYRIAVRTREENRKLTAALAKILGKRGNG